MSVPVPTPPYPNTPAPAWYRDVQWKASYSKRNGVHYVGDDVIIDLTFPTAAYKKKTTARFDNGVDGATLTTTERGYYSNLFAVGGTPTYDATHAYGALSCLINAGNEYVEWQVSAIPKPQYGRFYLYATANPTEGYQILTGQAFRIQVLTNGKLLLIDQFAGTTTTTNSIGLNQWVRIEYKADFVGAQLEVKLFNDPDSASPTETAVRNGGVGTQSSVFRLGSNSQNWGSSIWIDNVVGADTAYPGPYNPSAPEESSVTYYVRDFYGTIVSAGTFDEYQEWFIPEVPSGGWDPGWYRIYLTGSQTDTNFTDAYGSSTFCVIKSDANFNTMPAALTVGGIDAGNDFVMKGVMGMGTSRISIANANAPTTGIQTLAGAVTDAGIASAYWLDNGIPDATRPAREGWCAFPHQTWDALNVSQQGGGDWGLFYLFDTSLDGDQVFVEIVDGTAANTEKVNIYFPDSSTLVETFDNIDNSTEAVTVINAGSTRVRFFKRSSGRANHISPTALGAAYRDGIVSVVSTLYPLGITRFEGPENEPALNAETAYRMKLFQASVHAGDANAKAIGPCSIDIWKLTGIPGNCWDEFLAAGGGDFCDEISCHAYNSLTNGDMNLGRNQLTAWKALLTSHGQGSKPIWQTESTHGFTIVYGVYHPRRARKPLMDILVWEEFGIAREYNNQWYDVSQGFWDFPSWIENGDGGLEPQAVACRVLAEETWGKALSSSLDFGTPGNNIFIGQIYAGTAGKTVVLMATSFIEDAYVMLSVTGAGSDVTVVDGWGRETTTPVLGGLVRVPLTEVPSYVRLPSAATATVEYVNGWGTMSPSLGPSATTRTIGGTTYTEVADDAFMTNYNSGAGLVPATWATPPSTVEIKWGSSQDINHVVIWCGPCWQSAGTFIEFTVETTIDGTNWTVRETITKDPLSWFLFGTGTRQVGCFVETYWDEQWIFDVRLPATFSCTGVRINPSVASFGGEPLSSTDFGQGNSGQAFRIEEVGVYLEEDIPPPPDVTLSWIRA